KSLASSKHVTLPDAPKTYASNLKDKLSKLSGAAFDRAYIAAMVDDHLKDVREFEREAAGGADAEGRGGCRGGGVRVEDAADAEGAPAAGAAAGEDRGRQPGPVLAGSGS